MNESIKELMGQSKNSIPLGSAGIKDGSDYTLDTIDGLRDNVTVTELKQIPRKLLTKLYQPKDKREKPYRVARVPMGAFGVVRVIPTGNLREMSDPHSKQQRDRFTDAALLDETAQPSLDKRNRAFYNNGFTLTLHLKSSRDDDGNELSEEDKELKLQEFGLKYNKFVKQIDDWSQLKSIKLEKKIRTAHFAALVQGRTAVKIFPRLSELSIGQMPLSLKSIAAEHMGNVVIEREIFEIVALRIQSVDDPQQILLPDEMIYVILRDSGLRQEERFYGRSIMEPYVQLSRINRRAVEYDYAKAISASYNPKITIKMPVQGTPEEKAEQLNNRAAQISEDGVDVIAIESDEFSDVTAIPNAVNHEMMSRIRTDIDNMMIAGMGSTKAQIGRTEDLNRDTATIMEVENIRNVRTPDENELADFFESELLNPLLSHLAQEKFDSIPVRIVIQRIEPEDEISISSAFEKQDKEKSVDPVLQNKGEELDEANIAQDDSDKKPFGATGKKKLDTVKIYFNEISSTLAAAGKVNEKDLISSLAVKTELSKKQIKSKIKSSKSIVTAIGLLFSTLKSKEKQFNKLQKSPLPHTKQIKQLEDEMELLQEKVITERELNNIDDSSFIGSATYTPELQTVGFVLNGKTYHYCSVPQRTWDSYTGSPSKGVAYNRIFKGQHTC